MKIVINIKTDNAAFQENHMELEEILHQAACNIAQDGARNRNLYDSNGNNVGAYKVTGK